MVKLFVAVRRVTLQVLQKWKEDYGKVAEAHIPL